MANDLFPRTTVGGVSLSRMIIGTNWMLGWSHRSPAQDHQILRKFSDGEKAFPMLKTFLDRGVDTIMGMMQQEKVMQDAVNYAQEKSGKKMIVIDTPIINVDDNEAALCVGLASYRAHKTAALVGTVSGVYINVERPKAEGAVIAGAASHRKHLFTAISAYKA